MNKLKPTIRALLRATPFLAVLAYGLYFSSARRISLRSLLPF